MHSLDDYIQFKHDAAVSPPAYKLSIKTVHAACAWAEYFSPKKQCTQCSYSSYISCMTNVLSLEVNGCKPKWTELFPPDHLPPHELFQVEDIPQKPVHKSGECLLIICSASSGMFLGFVSSMLSKFVVTAITVSRENPQIPLTSLLKITKTIPYTM